MITTQQIMTTTADNAIIRAFWPFDNSTNDLYGIYNGVGINNITYSSSTITGYGSALNLSGNRSQSINITVPINLANSSFTFELWMYVYSFSTPHWLGIIQQCSNVTFSRCLHIGTRDQKAYMGFYYNDCGGTSQLKIATWYHLSFIYDSGKRQQLIYLNGIQDGFNNASDPLLPQSQILPIFIGKLYLGIDRYFNGIIDQVSFVNRAKNDEEILRDATLIVEYLFDNNSPLDSGPNKINGSNFNVSYTTNGRVNGALLFSNTNNHSSFIAEKLVLLGISNNSYSIAMWLRPTLFNTKGIIVYLDTKPNNSWCIPILGFTSSGRLVAQSIQNGQIINTTGPSLPVGKWTHVAYIYSMNYGVRVYVNGTFVSSTGPFQYTSANASVNILLGNCRTYNQCNCTFGSIVPAQYYGAIDEFQVYSRELSLNDIQELVNL